jgi:hypothetical protein
MALLGAAFVLPSSNCIAQQVTGELGSPSATTTISGKQLPPPDPKFGGVIKEKASESKPWWPPRIVPPKGAPNMLLIMTDDAGFGVPGTFGGVVPDPGLGSHRAERVTLHAVSLHVAVLPDARCLDHRAQPSRGRLRGRVLGEELTGAAFLENVERWSPHLGAQRSRNRNYWSVSRTERTKVSRCGAKARPR